MSESQSYTAFEGNRWLTTGDLSEVLASIKRSGQVNALIFEDRTGKQRDFDFSGTEAEVLSRATPPLPKSGPGRPKLGVVSREISMLPRHWEWLELQPNGASAALRRLVDEARLREGGVSDIRLAVEALGRVMTAIAGNETGFEEAMRHLYAQNFETIRQLSAEWPEGIRGYIERRLAVIASMAK